MNDFFQSKKYQWIIVITGGLIAALFVFEAGVFVGYHKASFSYRWGENYERNFGGPRGGFFGGHMMMDDDFVNPHGTFGKILKIELPQLTVEGNDGKEKIIQIGDDTIIRRVRDIVSGADLHVGDNIVVIGEPNAQGQIESKLIRIMPAMATSTQTAI